MTERLETNEERRRELLADIAHELRTPLQVIRGHDRGRCSTASTRPTQSTCARSWTGPSVMARLLDDLRTLSMAEAGVLALHRETVDPRAVAEDARTRVPVDGRGGRRDARRRAATPTRPPRSRPTRCAWRRSWRTS